MNLLPIPEKLFMPLLLLIIFLVDLVSVAFLFIDYHLWREWYHYRHTLNDDYAQRCLIGAIALLTYSLMGKFPLSLLVSKRRKNEDEPHMFDSKEKDIIELSDGTKLHVAYYGKKDAQPIIFVHGWNANINEWYYQRKHFEKDHYVIMFDLRGLGKSTRPQDRDFSLKEMAEDLDAVIKHTGAKKPILWGHSIGGMTILTFLAKYKKDISARIKGVILEHTTYTNPVKTSILSRLLTAIQKLVLVPICYLMIGLSPVFWLMRWISFLNGNSQLTSRFLTFAGTQTVKQLNFITLISTMAPPAVTARGVLGMFKYDVTHQLPELRIPTLIIAANKDRLTKPDASYYMEKNIPGAQVVTVAPGGHQALVERHSEVNKAAEKFIISLHEEKTRTDIRQQYTSNI
jgi:pimeloyl-ACP methyl ester carboxylesterase